MGDLTLIAYWALDEMEGIVAHDSSGNNDASIIGDPVWLPNRGMICGALQLDGVDDYVSTDFVLNPAHGSFSVFVWIKGGAPGQVIISETGRLDLLSLDPQTGFLMTELKGFGRGASPLLSLTSISDNNWHRIGLVWDGSYRTLFVDSVAVAEGTQDGLQSTDGGLYIGCGNPLQPGTFFSGLIDDVRIYNRAVSP